MSNITVILDHTSDWNAYYPSSQIVTAETYLAEPSPQAERGQLVINLCRNYKYLSHGYYCSLLAESRKQKVIPSIRTINDLSKKPLYATDLEKLNPELNKLGKQLQDNDTLRIKIFFGQTEEDALQDFARQLFEMFPCPILEVDFKKSDQWAVTAIRPHSLNKLSGKEEDLFANALDHFSQKIWRKPRSRKKYRYDLAILANPEEKLPPSDKGALKNFVKAGNELGIDVDMITKKDIGRLAEYDALFIRETTAINDHTYQFAKKAESEGMVVIDDPDSILRCTNKVFLANLLAANKIPTPKSIILDRHRSDQVEQIEENLTYPVVLKIPDGSFSRGVVKVSNKEELKKYTDEFFKNSALILAQEFFYTDYDWRIGVLNNKPLFACQYFMSKGHWQIYKHADNGKTISGRFTTMPVHKAPAHVLKNAMKAANLIGSGFYGVDVKQRDNQSVVIEVNDNPNVDSGVEDVYLGKDLYLQIMQEFVRRLEKKRLGMMG